jgi:hypothetical protein
MRKYADIKPDDERAKRPAKTAADKAKEARTTTIKPEKRKS